MKKIVIAVLLAAAGLVVRKAYAGISVCDIGTSTSAVVNCLNGAGTFYGIQVDSATAIGEWGICYDSASISGFTFGIENEGVSTGKVLGTTTSSTTVGGVYQPSGIPALTVTNGITCNKKSGADLIQVYYTPF